MNHQLSLFLRRFFSPTLKGGTGGGNMQSKPRHHHPLGLGKVMAGQIKCW
jgi:hypothetical protein